MPVLHDLGHSPDSHLNFCTGCNMPIDRWRSADKNKYCPVKTSHSFTPAKTEREPNKLTNFPDDPLMTYREWYEKNGFSIYEHCASCGLDASSWTVWPKCPSSMQARLEHINS